MMNPRSSQAVSVLRRFSVLRSGFALVPANPGRQLVSQSRIAPSVRSKRRMMSTNVSAGSSAATAQRVLTTEEKAAEVCICSSPFVADSPVIFLISYRSRKNYGLA
jgi:hypothetical protein